MSPKSTATIDSMSHPLPAPSTPGSTGDEQPAVKRRRIAVACTSCRHRKSRCDGARPSCASCADGGFPCVYEGPLPKGPVKKRVRGDLGERLRVIERTLQQLVRNQETTGDRPMQGRLLETQDILQRFILEPKNEAQAQNTEVDTVDGLAAMHSGDVDSRFFAHCAFFGGPSSNIRLLNIVSRATSVAFRTARPFDGLNQSILEESITRSQSPIATTAVSTLTSPTSTSPQMLPVESRAVYLIELYFSDTGTMFPFISEEQVLASYYACKDKQFSNIRHSLLCLFNAIFAFATYISAMPGEAITKCATEADIYYHRALAARASGTRGSNDVEQVQSLLLLGLYCQGTQRPEEACTLHGLAVQVALKLGLHSPSRLNQLQGLEREIRKRLWFGCFMMDRTLSMTLGRPPIIQDAHMNLELPLDASLDSLLHTTGQIRKYNETRQTNTSCFFIATLKLYKIMGTVVQKLYGQNLDEEIIEESGVQMQDMFLIEEDLNSWKMGLPEKLLLQPWVNSGSRERPQPPYHPVFARLSVVTQLRYLNIRILLHRPVLSHLLWKRRTRSLERNREKNFREETWNSSVMVCQDSATKIIDIIHCMADSVDLLGAWWYSVYFTFNAALIIFGCILLSLDTRHDTSSPTADLGADPKLFSELTRAIEVTERVGKDAKPARQVLAILTKIVKICLRPETKTSLGTSEGVAIGTSFNPQEPVAPASTCMIDPLESSTQWWGEENLEELGDIVGVDPGLISLMTM
ncbi:transcriptional regulatory protein GAL4 [Fusarium oxysporum Fo47]|uniref:transcriptional regulatory protein GAL4 n=1 Tax=Fusarium oxysporum Fo47 TaxID=660027 RepID=UPI0028699594|nr:transcriptional regulatory protein GAL4 [Fusarium oxysporum Fo47]WJG35924.1 transcriptional regulatory protein GAL4 [Fusarium oxysporum Fo47]